MKAMTDAFWRAAAYCLHPRVIGMSLLPLVVGLGLSVGLAWAYWDAAVAAVVAAIDDWPRLDAALRWLEAATGAGVRAALAPMIVVALALPAVVALSVLLVALMMVPTIVDLIAVRRFPSLERRRGAGALHSAGWSLMCTLLAFAALALTLPLWLVPPFMLVLPPLIWGWLTYRVMSFDALAEHASADERRALMRRHRWPLLGIGIVCGYLGAAPTLLWAVSAATLILAPLLIGVSVWLYTLVFAFSALWFAHFCLSALDALRAETAAAPAQSPIHPL